MGSVRHLLCRGNCCFESVSLFFSCLLNERLILDIKLSSFGKERINFMYMLCLYFCCRLLKNIYFSLILSESEMLNEG